MTKLTILCENTAAVPAGILGEHGFAVLIERENDTLLFDTGQGYTLAHNAEMLKKDLRRVGSILLSHGHYDHTGGLKQALQLSGSVPVYCHPAVFTERFSLRKEGAAAVYRSAGMPFPRPELEALGARFVFNTEFTEIAPGLYLTGAVPRLSSFEKNDRRLVVKKDGGYVQDQIPDDQSLVIETASSLTVVLGCAHAGMINMLNYIQEQLPGKSLHTVLGGTHMGFLSESQLGSTIEQLQKFSLERIGVSHCTGLAPAMKLFQTFGERFFFANAGSVIDLS